MVAKRQSATTKAANPKTAPIDTAPKVPETKSEPEQQPKTAKVNKTKSKAVTAQPTSLSTTSAPIEAPKTKQVAPVAASTKSPAPVASKAVSREERARLAAIQTALAFARNVVSEKSNHVSSESLTQMPRIQQVLREQHEDNRKRRADISTLAGDLAVKKPRGPRNVVKPNKPREVEDANEDLDLEQQQERIHQDDVEHYAQFDQEGNQLVSLTADFVNAATVRTEEDEQADKLDEKISNRQYFKRSVRTPQEQKQNDLEAKERLERTIFLGNVPITAKQSDIKAFVRVPVDSIRLRSVGFLDSNKARWVALAKKQFHEKRDSCCAYVVLKDKKDLAKVLPLNQQVMLDKHIRVDLATSEGKVNHASSIFVGNLPWDITEESLYSYFINSLPQAEITAIRCVRDAKSGMGKGIAFVTFGDKLYVAEAIKHCHDQKTDLFQGRALRVTKVSPHAFDKTDAFKAELLKQRVLRDRALATKASRSDKLKSKILGENQSAVARKSTKVQGLMQQIRGNVVSAKPQKHAARQRINPAAGSSSAPNWMGHAAKPSDKAVLTRKKNAKSSNSKKPSSKSHGKKK